MLYIPMGEHETGARRKKVAPFPSREWRLPRWCGTAYSIIKQAQYHKEDTDISLRLLCTRS